MVRIIKEGQLPEERKYQVECSHCHTQFAFVEKEAEYVSGGQRDPDQLKIACPLCAHAVYTFQRSTYAHGSGWYDR